MDTDNTAIRALSTQLQHHPYRTLLIAAGVGYVLGGGLFTRLSFKVLAAAARMGAMPLLSRELAGVAEAALTARERSHV